ncbi:MAG: hypothetical protein JWO02_2511 [Solirubrobacterales bacterium]|nr:hypothetical protein [Solirubrobacterales bacterium]
MSNNLDGHCLCGSITYTCDAEPIMTAICHCTECQRQAGTAFSIIVGVPREQLDIKGDSLKVFETIGDDTGATAARNFCGTCGSPIISVLSNAEDIAWIKAGTLDDASWLEPELEAWTSSAQPWAAMPEREDRGYFPRGLDVG